MVRHTRNGARARLGMLVAAAMLAVAAMQVVVVSTPAAAGAAAAASGPLHINQSCNAFRGAVALGTSMRVGKQVVRACGPRPSFSLLLNVLRAVIPFLGSFARYPGYQCVELSARYLAAADGVSPPPGVMNGAQVVGSYARRFPRLFVARANGAKGKAPVRGDVISLAANKRFAGLGHTGVVLSSRVNNAGNGSIRTMEQNWGGPGGARGWHVYKVRKWKVVFPLLPHIKWLHKR